MYGVWWTIAKGLQNQLVYWSDVPDLKKIEFLGICLVYNLSIVWDAVCSYGPDWVVAAMLGVLLLGAWEL